MKILLAEDDPISLEITSTWLKKLGHEPILARDGEEAWEAFKKSPISVVISDWMMPKMDGLALCRRIRESSKPSYTYFVILTAKDGSGGNLRKAAEEGVDDFLSKPLNEEVLWARLKVAERILVYMTQVGQLKALLPICMYCRKIRDDNDYWSRVEEYITHETGAQFSHGICPDCYEKKIVPTLNALEGDAPTPG